MKKFLDICHRNTYPPRTNIIVPGDLADALYYVIEGSLSVSMTGEDQRDYILTYLSAGDFIGEMGLFVPAHQREVIIQTKSRCKLAKISYSELDDAFRNKLRDHAVRFLQIVGGKLSNRLLKSNRKVLTLSSVNVEGRIAKTLLDLCEEPVSRPHPRGKQLKITRDEMSRLVGCSREVASRSLKSLEEQGMIMTEGRSIIVVDDSKAAAPQPQAGPSRA